MKKSNNIHHLLFLAILFSGFSFHGQSQTYLPTDNLEGWWPFNGNAIDESYAGHDGTVNGATLTTDRFNEPDKAYYFNGVNNNITTAWASILGTSSRTVSFWFNSPMPILPTGHIHGAELGMVCWGGSGSNNEGRGFAAVMMDNNQPGLDINTAYKTCNFNSLGYWNHYVLSFSSVNGSNLEAVKLYLNGNLVTDISRTFNITTPINTVNDVNFMFGSTITAGQFFLGKLDDIGIWSRELNESEIMDLYYASDLQLAQEPLIGTNPGNTGTIAKFKILALGSTTGFNWQVKVGNTFTNISNSITYQGQNTNILSVAIPSDSNFNGRIFRCIVGRQNRSDTSATKTLNIVTSSEKIKEEGHIFVYPNPAKDQFRISGLDKRGEVQLIDKLGRHYAVENTGKDVFSLTNIEKGIYFVRFKDLKGIYKQMQLIVW